MAVTKKSAKPGAKPTSPAKSPVAAKKPTKAKAKAVEAAPVPPPSKHTIGEQVTHPMFGTGTVTAIEADKLTIDFGKGVVKQIVDYYVKARK